MKLPNKIVVGPSTIRVSKEELDDAFGSYAGSKSLIKVNTFLSGDQEQLAFIHEILHALIDISGIRRTVFKLDKDKEEDFVSAFEAALLAFIKDNPKSIEYLRKRSSDGTK